MKKLLLAAIAGLLMAACSETSTGPSAPKASARDKASADLECKSGYIVASDKDGNLYCAESPDANAVTRSSISK